ncbi:hypothetical protein HYE22_03225 [Mycoplasmopsis bovis]|nr:hypothetical protein [Mycoplasmopsis bovis]QQH24176.1 hypothetical protein HYE22_03225 [Mycoplasmopsis bovis]
MKKALKLLSNNSAYKNVFESNNVKDNWQSLCKSNNKYANTYDKFIQRTKLKYINPKSVKLYHNINNS